MPQQSLVKPLTVVIIGATGDLAQKKLLPSLFRLFEKNLLPQGSSIVAFSRRPWTDQEFRAFTKTSFPLPRFNQKKFKEFLDLISYHEGYFEKQEAFDRLVTRLAECDVRAGTYTEKYVYLSVSPDSYAEIITRLGKAFADVPKKLLFKLLIEKPFGKDLLSAQRLEKVVATYFKADDVFLVDHYLGKAALHMLTSLFRGMPEYFKKYWNYRSVSSVGIKLYESKDVDGRTEFYDAVGAVRDIGQNHILETLASVAVPTVGSEKKVQTKRQLFLESLSVDKNLLIRGQYEGYTSEIGMLTSVETYFKIGFQSSDPRWKKTSFVIEGGKALPESVVDVTVTMKNAKKDFLVRIQPKPTIFIPGVDGLKDQKIKVDETLDAYEEIFFAAFTNDASRFPSIGEIYASWKLIDKVRAALEKTPLHIYKKGTVPIL